MPRGKGRARVLNFDVVAFSFKTSKPTRTIIPWPLRPQDSQLWREASRDATSRLHSGTSEWRPRYGFVVVVVLVVVVVVVLLLPFLSSSASFSSSSSSSSSFSSSCSSCSVCLLLLLLTDHSGLTFCLNRKLQIPVNIGTAAAPGEVPTG